MKDKDARIKIDLLKYEVNSLERNLSWRERDILRLRSVVYALLEHLDLEYVTQKIVRKKPE